MTQICSSILDVLEEWTRGSDLHFRKITVGSGFEWGKREVRETRGKLSEVIDNKVLAKCYGGQSQGMLTEVKRNG